MICILLYHIIVLFVYISISILFYILRNNNKKHKLLLQMEIEFYILH